MRLPAAEREDEVCMNISGTRLLMVIALFGALLTAGCGGSQNKADFHLRQDVDMSVITKVAVLPLENLTNDRFAGDAIRHVLVNELLLSGLVDVNMPGDTMAAAEKAGIRTAAATTAEQIKKVGAALKVQAVVFGSVQKYGENRIGSFTVPEVSLTLMMAETQTGTILWSVALTEVGDNFAARHFGGRAETLSETAVKAVRRAILTMKS